MISHEMWLGVYRSPYRKRAGPYWFSEPDNRFLFHLYEINTFWKYCQ